MWFYATRKLKTHCQNGSDLSGHISHKEIPGVEYLLVLLAMDFQLLAVWR